MYTSSRWLSIAFTIFCAHHPGVFLRYRDLSSAFCGEPWPVNALAESCGGVVFQAKLKGANPPEVTVAVALPLLSVGQVTSVCVVESMGAERITTGCVAVPEVQPLAITYKL